MLNVQAPSPLVYAGLVSKRQKPSLLEFSGHPQSNRSGLSGLNSMSTVSSVVVAGLALLGLSGRVVNGGPGVTEETPDVFTQESQPPLGGIPYPPTATSTGDTWISVLDEAPNNAPVPVPSNPFAPANSPLAVINTDERDRLRRTLELGKKAPSGLPKGKKGKYPTERPYPFRKGGGLRIDPYASSKPAQQVGSGYRAKTF
ncbi:MAG: hypothetical protein K2X01_00995 [Cyanobacteria bacterium]|nr:hypothetical protein [Cyanobacteriota bacterium]